MSINEIINGTAYASARGDTDIGEGEDFPGLIPLVESYLDSVNVDVVTHCELGTYLDLIRKRASGELWTAAKWIREFVASHPGYMKDSVVSEEITKALVGAVIAAGEREQKGEGFKGLDVKGLGELLGRFRM
jgi:glutamate--cysteine ligase catalytic subunit